MSDPERPDTTVDAIGDWSWDDGELVHEDAQARLTTAHPASRNSWVLVFDVESGGWQATVTVDVFPDVGQDGVSEDASALTEAMRAVDSGERRLEAVEIEDPVNKSFVDVMCVRTSELPADTSIEDIAEQADNLMAMLHGEGAGGGIEVLDGLAESASRVPIEVFPTQADQLVDLELVDDA